MGGENTARVSPLPSPRGSSPHGRGKLIDVLVGQTRSGLIPAWAGKTVDCQHGWHCWRGSSPHGRGKPVEVQEDDDVVRLIPAWAGKTLYDGITLHQGEAHPRMGGENSYVRTVVVSHLGSSPHGRGKLLGVAWSVYRMGGENSPFLWRVCFGDGSSPYGRGKRRRRNRRGHPPGLIPAWAGKTPPKKPPWTSTWAHPRMGGETVLARDSACLTRAHPRAGGENAEVDKKCPHLGAHPRAGGENAV